MHIGFVLGRLGGVDGVALETDKWVEVLRRAGHRVSILTGALEAERDGAEILPALAFDHPACIADQRAAFFEQAGEEAALLAGLETQAGVLAEAIESWLTRKRIDVLIPENACALPYHLAMGLALDRVLARSQVRAVAHHHDFPWERGDRYRSRFPGVEALVADAFPPRHPELRHAVINTAARAALQTRFGVEATVVPNVMDFEAPFAVRDAVNRGMKTDLGLPEDARALFQVTRIVPRKGIETAIELVQRLQDSRVHLVITGSADDDFSTDYLTSLKGVASTRGVAARVHFLGHRFRTERGLDDQGRQVYSLEDAYAGADAMTYFSTYEGFGNAFVEAVLARVPIFVNDYQPVYWPDIGSKGFETVQISDGVLTDAAVAAAAAVLADPELRHSQTENNFLRGREHFSFEVLGELLAGLLL